MNIWEIFLQPLPEDTLIIILVSTVIGGIFTIVSTYISQNSIPQFKAKRDRKISLQKYSYPCLMAVRQLDSNISYLLSVGLQSKIKKEFESIHEPINEKKNLVKNSSNEHNEFGIEQPNKITDFNNIPKFDSATDNYYKIITLYSFGCFIGWLKIIEDYDIFNVQKFRFQKEFDVATGYTPLITILKTGLTSDTYFSTVDKTCMNDIYSSAIPKMALTAIADLMIKESKENEQDVNHTVISLAEFSQKYEFDIVFKNVFKKWFKYPDNLFSDLIEDKSSAKWNRVVIFHTNLRAIQYFLRGIVEAEKINDKDIKKWRDQFLFNIYLVYAHPEILRKLRTDYKKILDDGLYKRNKNIVSIIGTVTRHLDICSK